MGTADANLSQDETAMFEILGVRFTKGLQIFKDFTAEEIYDNLAEAIWEHERSPETSIWFSFWDRLNEGVNVPSMPADPAASGSTDAEGKKP